jgi:hypothetical protein
VLRTASDSWRSLDRWQIFCVGCPTRSGRAIKAACYSATVRLKFSGDIWFWRGPSPFHFVTVPDEESAILHAVSALVTYGWGVIPVLAEIGNTSWKTSLFPKDGGYLVPVKASVREVEELELGDTVQVVLTIDVTY